MIDYIVKMEFEDGHVSQLTVEGEDAAEVLDHVWDKLPLDSLVGISIRANGVKCPCEKPLLDDPN